MRLLTAAICESAQQAPDGKLELKGVFHDLYAPGFPAKQERLTLVIVVEWDQHDQGRHQFRVDLTAPDGTLTLSVDGYSEVTPRPPDRAPPRTTLVMPLEEVIFPIPGAYEFPVKVKGEVLPGPRLYLMSTEDAAG